MFSFFAPRRTRAWTEERSTRSFPGSAPGRRCVDGDGALLSTRALPVAPMPRRYARGTHERLTFAYLALQPSRTACPATHRPPTHRAAHQHDAAALFPPAPAHMIDCDPRWPQDQPARRQRPIGWSTRAAACRRHDAEQQTARRTSTAFEPAWARAKARLLGARSARTSARSMSAELTARSLRK